MPLAGSILAVATLLTNGALGTVMHAQGSIASLSTLSANGELGYYRALNGDISSTATLSADGNLHQHPALMGAVAAQAGLTVAGSRMPQLSGTVQAMVTALATLTSTPNIGGVVDGQATVRGTATVSGQGLTVYDVYRSILSLWGISCCTPDSDQCMQSDVIGAINASLQTIYSQAHQLDYFNRTALTVTVPANTRSVELEARVQSLLGPVKVINSRIPLSPVSSEHELDYFMPACYGSSETVGEPRAYFLRSQHQSAGDNVALSLLFTPVPNISTDISVDVSLEAPRYTAIDITSGTPVEIPHRYAELLLVPLVRKWATAHRLYTRKDSQPQIDEQYELAKTALGMLNPDTPATASTKP